MSCKMLLACVLGLVVVGAGSPAEAKRDKAAVVVLPPHSGWAPAWYKHDVGVQRSDYYSLRRRAPLMADELVKVQAAVFKRLKRVRGVKAVRPKAARAKQEAAPLEGCAVAPRADQVLAYHYADHHFARPSVHCGPRGDQCALTVELVDNPKAKTRLPFTVRMAAKVKGDPTDVKKWVAAARKLKVTNSAFSHSSFSYSGGNSSTVMQASVFGTWKLDPEQAKAGFAGLEKAFDGCVKQAGFSGPATVGFAVDVAPDGAVRDAMATITHRPGSAPTLQDAGLSGCMEAALKTLSFEAATGRKAKRKRRRAGGEVIVIGARPPWSLAFESPHVSTKWLAADALTSQLGVGRAVDACVGEHMALKQAVAKGELRMAATVKFGPTGDVASAGIEPMAESLQPARLCLERALGQMQWTCLPGEAGVRGALVLRRWE